MKNTLTLIITITAVVIGIAAILSLIWPISPKLAILVILAPLVITAIYVKIKN